MLTSRATGSIKINISQIQELGSLWGSDEIQSVYESLAANSSTANSGDIVGNRMFYNNDYMVSRLALTNTPALMLISTCSSPSGAAWLGIYFHASDVLQSHFEHGVRKLAECMSPMRASNFEHFKPHDLDSPLDSISPTEHYTRICEGTNMRTLQRHGTGIVSQFPT